ncbi:MAG: LacI family DNA-binding transcriptional regulator [Anaerolineae bacterium]|nr:LacI family DNA-binding transcriptional regulator [Anaerolineae bacterium]
MTIQDVAQYANVSRSTVSRVLNNNSSVDAELAARVMVAVRTLDYHPNRAARRLRKQTEDVVGLLISDIRNPFFGSVIRGIEDEAYKQHVNLVLCNTDEASSKIQNYLQVMQAERVSGLIVVPTHDDNHDILREVQADGIPIVLIDRSLTYESFDRVKVDNINGAFHAVNHLLEHKYRRIGIIYPEVETGYERLQGYQKALRSNGVEYDSSLVEVCGYTIDSSHEATKRLMAQESPPDALFTANNLLTLGAMRALRMSNIRIPQDIALIGFDDMPWATELYTPLTVVSQPTYELGKQAFVTLYQRIKNPKMAYQSIFLTTSLIIRESCGCLPS